MVLDGKSSQEYPVNAEFLKTPFLVLHFSCYTLMAFLMMLSVILLSMLMILLSILGVIKQLAVELKSDLRDNADWGTKWLVDFNAGKTQLVSFAGQITLMGLSLRESRLGLLYYLYC